MCAFLIFIFFAAAEGAVPASAQLRMPDIGNSGVRTKVEAAFSDAPDMVAVAACESGFREYGPDGQALRGGADQNYIGIFQISVSGHAEEAKNLGYDIYTTDGNIGFARYLYNHSGTEPWISCAPQTPAAPALAQAASSSTPAALSQPHAAAAAAAAITANLQLNMVSPQVQTLQRLLNSLGYTIAKSGPGSPGNETEKFGPLTRQAVRKLQCDNKIVCSGAESSTGFGRVGPLTRILLAKLAAKL